MFTFGCLFMIFPLSVTRICMFQLMVYDYYFVGFMCGYNCHVQSNALTVCYIRKEHLHDMLAADYLLTASTMTNANDIKAI